MYSSLPAVASVTGPGAALDTLCQPPCEGAQRVREAEQHGSQHTEGQRDCCVSRTLKAGGGGGDVQGLEKPCGTFGLCDTQSSADDACYICFYLLNPFLTDGIEGIHSVWEHSCVK